MWHHMTVWKQVHEMTALRTVLLFWTSSICGCPWDRNCGRPDRREPQGCWKAVVEISQPEYRVRPAFLQREWIYKGWSSNSVHQQGFFDTRMFYGVTVHSSKDHVFSIYLAIGDVPTTHLWQAFQKGPWERTLNDNGAKKKRTLSIWHLIILCNALL